MVAACTLALVHIGRRFQLVTVYEAYWLNTNGVCGMAGHAVPIAHFARQTLAISARQTLR